MKLNYTIILLTLMLTACKDTVEPEESKPAQRVVVNEMAPAGEEQFESLRSMLPEKEVSSYYDTLTRTYYSWSMSTSRGDSQNLAHTSVSSWDMTSEPRMLWMYTDSMSCDEGVPAIEPELDSMRFLRFGMEDADDIAIAYIMGCGGDAETNKMYLTFISARGEKLGQFYGYPISYQPKGGVDSMDLRYTSSLGHGKHAQGRIENYYDMDQFSPTNRKTIERIWRSALRHNIGIPEPVGTSPAQ